MDVYEKLLALAKRRGFIHPSYEIYGGEAGFYDYGPLGTRLKHNIENVWRDLYVFQERCYEIATPVITPFELLKASGHVDEFLDDIGTCRRCGLTVKVEDLADGSCPACSGPVDVSTLNLMFETCIGAKKRKQAFLRPETAQGIFVNFPLLYEFFRRKMPFGVVQLGKGFRNEVSPRQGIIRLREFSMAEAEVFFEPDRQEHPRFEHVKDENLSLVTEHDEELTATAGEAVSRGIVATPALAYYLVVTKRFFERLGIEPHRARFRQHKKDEMAHYARDCWDAELHSDRFGWVECVGIADRAAYDLTAHMKATGTDMRAFRRFETPVKRRRRVIVPDMGRLGRTFRHRAKAIAEHLAGLDAPEAPADIEVVVDGETLSVGPEFYEVREEDVVETGEKFVPRIIEPSYGIDRIFYFVLEHAFHEEEKEGETYVTLRLPPVLAPITAGVFPLVGKDGLPDIAGTIEENLRKNGILSYYDDGGSIGRRYARMDEVGTPFCVTVDYQTKEDDTVTVRRRDTAEQVRVSRNHIVSYLRRRLKG
jgi:glycyl-tRNA synthetase